MRAQEIIAFKINQKDKTMRGCLTFVVGALAILATITLALTTLSQVMAWQVTSEETANYIVELSIFTKITKLDGTPLMPNLPLVAVKNQLEATDALLNSVLLFMTTAGNIAVAIVGMALIPIFGLIQQGLEGVANILLGLLLLALAILIAGIIAPLGLWFQLNFEQGTASYHALWVVCGLIALTSGYGAVYSFGVRIFRVVRRG